MIQNRHALAGLALLGACAGGAAAPDDVPAADAACVDDRAFFRDEVWPQVIDPVCMGCHTSDGAARDSDLVFATTARPDFLDVDREVLARVAGLERDGTSILLIKPTGGDAHGGGKVLEPGSPGLQILTEFVRRLDAPVSCPDAGDDPVEVAGLVLAPPTTTLRKAALLLSGRLPTPREVDAVRAGGEPALARAIDALLDEPAFIDRLIELFNDELLTDRYLNGRDGLGILQEDVHPNKMWFEDASDYGADYNQLYDRTSQAVAREPLQLIAHVVRERRPWTEILTADYTMVNAYSAMAYGVEGATWPDADDPSSFVFHPAQVPGIPHAGLLSTPAFLNRFPTTPTNRNRHRAWKLYKTFLATDILAFAERPIDPTTSSVHNPTMNDPQCTVCHATMDPVAGAFQDFDEEGAFRPPVAGWYADMVPPGFGELDAPSGTGNLSWLAREVADDPRFPLATVRTMLRLLTGIEPLSVQTAGDDPVRLAALREQDAWVDAVARGFVERDHDIRYVVQQVVLSRYFRAAEATDASEGTLLQAGMARLLTPEELNRKIKATLGMPWTRRWGDDDLLLDDYQMLYGGIDSFGVTTRLRDPNGVISAIGLRMATEMACYATSQDLTLPAGQRRLLPYTEPSFVPVTPEGFEVPDAEQAIRENIRWLHHRLLGEELTLDDPEVEATYALWRETWVDVRDAVAAGTIDDALPSDCRAYDDPVTGASLPDEREVVYDENGVIRAWMAVLAYQLTDFRFLYE